MSTDDDLLAALRRRATDPDRRLECQTSAFFEQVSRMDAGQLLGALGKVQDDLRRHLADPGATPPDVAARVSELAASMQQPADRPLPAPVPLDVVDAAEAALGVRLPSLLRRVWTEVADGGFGPGYGLLGVGPDGWTDDQGLGVVARAVGLEPGVVPIAYLGDVLYACVDTRRPGAPVVEYDGSDDVEPYVELSASVGEWLQRWSTTPGHAEEAAALEAEAAVAQRDFFKQAWAGLTPEQREQYGITDEMLATGEFPD